MQDGVPAISVRGVRRSFGAVRALDGVDLDVRAGEFFSVLGPSGCGKTTLLRVIGGLETADAGTVALHGADVAAVPAERRDVNTVFQSYALFPHMSVFDNVAFGLRRRGVGRAEVGARVRAMLELVELAGRERDRPHTLSGGQRQRVALARALVNRPRALLLDEPLAALDARLRQAMQAELKRVQREVGVAFVHVTHDQAEALALSDRVAVLNEGRVEQIGTPREVYERPATRFVAGFVGTSNLIAGVAEAPAGGGPALLRFGDAGHVLVPGALGGPLEVAVRPERVRMTRHRPDASVCALRGTVTDVAYRGASTTYRVTTPAADLHVYAQNTAPAPFPTDPGAAEGTPPDGESSARESPSVQPGAARPESGSAGMPPAPGSPGLDVGGPPGAGGSARRGASGPREAAGLARESLRGSGEVEGSVFGAGGWGGGEDSASGVGGSSGGGGTVPGVVSAPGGGGGFRGDVGDSGAGAVGGGEALVEGRVGDVVWVVWEARDSLVLGVVS
ncbi:ATP-binding cassette domain-containing protein [Actinomadura flavalba]|uniref:ATP-binding cassette domain-containing protein n=1 Tax=Actinomadura flavalba TaxID=1120938 RepID=UPI00037E947E